MKIQLEHPFEDVPRPAETIAVASGIKWLRMPLPFKGLDHINLWLLEDGDGWTIVDCGLRSSKVRDLWERLFETELEGRPVVRLIATHFHPDHLGLAGWLQERWSAPLWMTRSEWLFGRMLSLDVAEEAPPLAVEFYSRAGFGERAREALVAFGYNHYAKAVAPIPARYHRIQQGEGIRIGANEWRVMIGHGHSPEHACLYCEKLGVMISGDQILPYITPHIGVYLNEPEANPLKEYLDSLQNFRDLPDDTLVLPSHQTPFRGVQRRLAYLFVHHEDRLATLAAVCAEPATALEIVPKLFRRELDQFQTVLALGETLAHLNYLAFDGRLAWESDGQGIMRYQVLRSADAA